jgi:hypothetical protein
MMRAIKTLLFAGAAAATLIGVAALAGEIKSNTHVLTVQLPGGGVEQIRYTGDVAPQVVLAPGVVPLAVFSPSDLAVDQTSPFGMLDRMSAQMDREMAAMMAEVRAAPLPLAAPGQLQQAALARLPAGAETYSIVSNFSGGHACTQSVQITSQGPGRQPLVVSHRSGDCGAGQATTAPAGPAAASLNGPRAIPAKSETVLHPAGPPADAGGAI